MLGAIEQNRQYSDFPHCVHAESSFVICDFTNIMACLLMLLVHLGVLLPPEPTLYYRSLQINGHARHNRVDCRGQRLCTHCVYILEVGANVPGWLSGWVPFLGARRFRRALLFDGQERSATGASFRLGTEDKRATMREELQPGCRSLLVFADIVAKVHYAVESQ